MDMRECEAGSVLDEFHFSMWAGFLRSMLGNDAVRAQFESDTGLQPLIMSPPKNGLERMIDEATGVGQMQADYMSKFAVWVTDAYWGGPEHICPAIEATMRGAS